MAPHRRLSVATVTYFSELDLFSALLASLELAAEELHKRTSITVDYFVIDNSDDSTYFHDLEVLRSNISYADSFCLHLIKSPKNSGYSGGNNLVLDQINSDYHLVLNPDVVLQPDSLWRAVDYMSVNPDVALLSPRVVGNAGYSHVIKTYPDCLTLALRYLNSATLNHYFSSRLAHYQCVHLDSEVDDSVELVGGCFIFIRTLVFKQLHGFDERFFMYFEDYDLSLKARDFGRLAYFPEVKISHSGGGVGRKALTHHLYFSASAIKFFMRYGWRLW